MVRAEDRRPSHRLFFSWYLTICNMNEMFIELFELNRILVTFNPWLLWPLSPSLKINLSFHDTYLMCIIWTKYVKNYSSYHKTKRCGQMDGQTEKVLTIGLLHFQCSPKYTCEKVLNLPAPCSDCFTANDCWDMLSLADFFGVSGFFWKTEWCTQVWQWWTKRQQENSKN